MNRIRQRYLILLLARCVEHTRNALLGLALDYLAFRIGRLWLVGAATVFVRNGRFVFLVAYALERLLLHLAGVGVDELDSCFVFSITLFIVHIAYPLVFTNEVNMPLAEIWHDFRQTGVPTLPVFVYMVGLVHYPRWTVRVTGEGVLRRVPVWIWRHCTLGDVFGGGWKVVLCGASALAIYYTILVPLVMFLLAVAELGWRRVGKEFHNVRVRFLHGFTDGNPPGGFRRPQRLGTNQTLPPFAYTALAGDQMRVLHLLPRGNSDTIRCEIEHVSLEKILVYEAMSYAWGPQVPEDVYVCREICVNDRRFRVTQRVYDLLHDRSLVFSPRTIWIDSICINQKDDVEKSWQVALMHHIFSRASRVTVWLGVAPDAHLAVDVFLELAHLFKNYPVTDAELWERYAPERRSARWLALGNMMEHPYFTRVWMVQEIAVNRNVHVVYGGQLLHWDTLTLVLRTLFMSNRLSLLVEDTAEAGKKRIGLLNGTNVIFLDRVRDALQKGEPPTLAEVLRSCWTLQATDRRDKIFALWALAADGDDVLVRPDYTKTETQVFTDAAVYLALRGTGDDLLRVLGCAGVGWPRSVPGIPSWAPDWSTVSRSLLGSFPKNSTSRYHPYGNLEASPLRVLRGESMMVEMDAVILGGDPILYLTSEFERPTVLSQSGYVTNLDVMGDRTGRWIVEALCLVANHLGHDIANTIYQHTGQPLEEVFWRTLMVDSGLYGADGAMLSTNTRPAPMPFGAYYRDYMRYHLVSMPSFQAHERQTLLAQLASIGAQAERDTEFFDPEDSLDRPRKSGLWVTSAQNRCLSRKLAITEHLGFVALVPPGTEPGDRIVIIPGVCTPMVVRPTGRWADGEAEKLVFSLVGECYVHGLMDAREWVKRDVVERIVLL